MNPPIPFKKRCRSSSPCPSEDDGLQSATITSDAFKEFAGIPFYLYVIHLRSVPQFIEPNADQWDNTVQAVIEDVCVKASYLCPDGQETASYLMTLLLSCILEKSKCRICDRDGLPTTKNW